jgi:hypothetical protein
MKRRTQIVLAGALLVGAAAISSMKPGACCDTGSSGGGACCPMMSGLNLLHSNSWVAVAATNKQPGVTASEAITHRQR